MEKQNIKTIFGIFLFGILLISSINMASATSDFINLGEYDIEYTYDEAVAGDRFALTVTITNQDNENKENIRFEFDEKDPFEFVRDDNWGIGTLNTGESVSKNFRIEVDEDANSGDYEIEFELTDSEDDYDDIFDIEVISNSAELLIGTIKSEPTTILPDMKDVKLTVSIENTGDKDAKYVKGKLVLPQGFTASNSYSDIVNLGTIQAGETKEAIFYIDTDKTLTSDLYFAHIDLRYENDNDEHAEKLEIDLPVQGIPQFLVTNIKTDPTKVTQKSTATIKIELKNIGEKEGKDTSIKVFEKSDQPFEFDEKTYYIGTLSSEDTGTAVFTFKVDGDATPNNYLLNIQIRTVYDNEVLVSEETISLQVYEYERTLKDYLKIVGLIAVIILVIFVLKKVLKKK